MIGLENWKVIKNPRPKEAASRLAAKKSHVIDMIGVGNEEMEETLAALAGGISRFVAVWYFFRLPKLNIISSTVQLLFNG